MLVYSSPFYQFEACEGYLRCERSANAFTTLLSMQQEHERVLEVCKASGFSTLLLDTRLATGRNDPIFENAFREYRQGMAEIFPRIAVLAQSSTGLLQVNRLSKADKNDTVVRGFDDVDKAVEYLLS